MKRSYCWQTENRLFYYNHTLEYYIHFILQQFATVNLMLHLKLQQRQLIELKRSLVLIIDTIRHAPNSPMPLDMPPCHLLMNNA